MEYCKRCFLYELTDGDYFKSIYEYIESLPDIIKADPETYKMRLAFCRSCDELINGMCKLCGCFVEVRAAKKMNSCAAFPPKW